MNRWKILVVDDDSDMHSVTRLALKRLEYGGRKVALISAASAESARIEMSLNPDITIILLDIVMENEDAGLSFIHYVRKELKNELVQIIIRTGHPGRAPEEQITIDYDINDYQEKSELSARKLKTSIITALRSYVALKTIDEHRKGLKQVIDASANVFRNQVHEDFELEVLTQLRDLLHLNGNPNHSRAGVVVCEDPQGELRITSAIGRFIEFVSDPLSRILDIECWHQKMPKDTANGCFKIDNYRVFTFRPRKDYDIFFMIEDASIESEWQKDLLEAFRLNISIALDNSFLYNEIEASRNDLAVALGEIAESRSSETGSHVKRVGEIAKILALKLGMNTKAADKIHMAATMHDLGKLAIQDEILNKPGKLTPEEFEIMKSHSRVGYEMLKSSNRELLQSAAMIALEHHENYDGTGYPKGLSGEDISLECRIVAIADVFDALGNKRVYKESWTKEQILGYMREQSGKKFDPNLMTVFFEHVDELLQVRERYPD